MGHDRAWGGPLTVLAVVRRFAPRFPGALAALVLGGISVALLGLGSKGVAIIGAVPAGLPGFAVPRVSLSDIGALVSVAGGLRRTRSGCRSAHCSSSIGRHVRIAAVYRSNVREAVS